jgi:hypothetical protein
LKQWRLRTTRVLQVRILMGNLVKPTSYPSSI